MPSSKRSPITYAPAFGGGIFRSKDEIAGDLAHLDGPVPAEMAAVLPAPDADGPVAVERTNGRTNERSRKKNGDPGRSIARTDERILAHGTNERSDEETNERSNERTTANKDKTPQVSSASDRTDERSNERPLDDGSDRSSSSASNVRTNERDESQAAPADHVLSGAGSEEERARVRHSFDIYRDQLLSLGDIQLARHRQTGRKPKLGDLVQEALDAFVARERQSARR